MLYQAHRRSKKTLQSSNGKPFKKKIQDFWLPVKLTNPPLWKIPPGRHTHTPARAVARKYSFFLHKNTQMCSCFSLSLSHSHVSSASLRSVDGAFIAVWLQLSRAVCESKLEQLKSIAALSVQLQGFSLRLLSVLFSFSFLSVASLFLTFLTSSVSLSAVWCHLCLSLILCVCPCESESSQLKFTWLKKVCVCVWSRFCHVFSFQLASFVPLISAWLMQMLDMVM